jgi:hypothetical protein
MMEHNRIALDEEQHHMAIMQDNGSLVIQSAHPEGHELNLTAEETYNLLVWLYDYRDTLYDLTHQGPEQQSKPRPQWMYKHEA